MLKEHYALLGETGRGVEPDANSDRVTRVALQGLHGAVYIVTPLNLRHQRVLEIFVPIGRYCYEIC